MRKEELVEILESVGVKVYEDESKVKDAREYPRIVFWDYVWEDILASGDAYRQVSTYQISFVSKTPRHPALVLLRNKLREAGIHPKIYHEYVSGMNDRKYNHSYFAVEVDEDVD